MFSLFNFSSIFPGEGVSRPNLPLCADAHGDRILLYHTTNFTVLILCSLIINYFVRLFCAPRLLHPGATAPPLLPLSYATVWSRFIATNSESQSVDNSVTIPYDAIRDAILTCAQKPTWVSLIYHTETTTKKWKTEKKLKSEKRICSEVTVQWTHVVSSEEEKEGCGGTDLQKRKVLSLELMTERMMEYHAMDIT